MFEFLRPEYLNISILYFQKFLKKKLYSNKQYKWKHFINQPENFRKDKNNVNY